MKAGKNAGYSNVERGPASRWPSYELAEGRHNKARLARAALPAPRRRKTMRVKARPARPAPLFSLNFFLGAAFIVNISSAPARQRPSVRRHRRDSNPRPTEPRQTDSAARWEWLPDICLDRPAGGRKWVGWPSRWKGERGGRGGRGGGVEACPRHVSPPQLNYSLAARDCCEAEAPSHTHAATREQPEGGRFPRG